MLYNVRGSFVWPVFVNFQGCVHPFDGQHDLAGLVKCSLVKQMSCCANKTRGGFPWLAVRLWGFSKICASCKEKEGKL